jgi:hypothetical protein
MPEVALRIKPLACAVVVLMLGSAIPATATAPKSVLLLYDEDRDFPGLAAIHNTLRTTFKEELRDGVDLYTESMNISQFKDEDYDRVLLQHYLKKYRGRKLDLIVAVMGPSLHFRGAQAADRAHSRYWPGAEVVRLPGAASGKGAQKEIPPGAGRIAPCHRVCWED